MGVKKWAIGSVRNHCNAFIVVVVVFFGAWLVEVCEI